MARNNARSGRTTKSEKKPTTGSAETAAASEEVSGEVIPVPISDGPTPKRSEPGRREKLLAAPPEVPAQAPIDHATDRLVARPVNRVTGLPITRDDVPILEEDSVEDGWMSLPVGELAEFQERSIPDYIPALPPLELTRFPSETLAAFQLGHLSRELWLWVDLHWSNMSNLAAGGNTLKESEFGVPDAAAQLSAARRILDPLIPIHVSTAITTSVDWFADFSHSLLDEARRGSDFFRRYNGKTHYWNEKWIDLTSRSNQAIPQSHPLRPIYDLGVAFGEFDL